MDGWVGRWMGGLKAVLKITYSKKNRNKVEVGEANFQIILAGCGERGNF